MLWSKNESLSPKKEQNKKETVIKVILVVVILKYRPKCMLLILLYVHGIPCKSDVLFNNKNKKYFIQRNTVLAPLLATLD